MIRFVDEHRGRFGVEPIIGVLRGADAGFLSVSGYYAATKRPLSARAVADATLCEQITTRRTTTSTGCARCAPRLTGPGSRLAGTGWAG